MSHLPRLWKFRLAVKGRFGYHREVFKVWDAQARAEGGTAENNPWNTTEPWPHATIYNDAGVRNYRTGADGIAATLRTLTNGYYPGLCRDYRRPGKLTADQIVARNAAEYGKWGTGAANVLREL
jgi:hypothetical protein